MEKTITIANAHSQDEPDQTFKLPLTECYCIKGSPLYGCLWVGDKKFIVYFNVDTGRVSIKGEGGVFVVR